MFIFEKITIETLPYAVEIINSNRSYNQQENDRPYRTHEEIHEEFLKSETASYLVKKDKDYIGVLDFLDHNPKDGYPWLGLLMIHAKYHSQGYGTQIYKAFERTKIAPSYRVIRLGVLESNMDANRFWNRLGFNFVMTKSWKSKGVNVLEKHLE